ncbi:MAG: DinB family protein [Acidimicrobiia bacterium]
MERCEECGFDYDAIARDNVPGVLQALGVRYRDLLSDIDDAVLRAHPLPDTWSALEYSCHMRDVFRVQRERVQLALSEEEPVFAPMRREERVIEERYNEQQPAKVGREITEAAESLAAALEALDGDAWTRTGIYNYPVTRVRTVEWIGRHTIHEGEHHLLDIERQVTPG